MKGYQVLSGEYCGNCKYFCKYYIHVSEGEKCYSAADYGHCGNPKLKKWWMGEHCQYFEPAQETAVGK